ncbi:MAG TPA: ABC transporter permease, partial [Blastocatellia bacterium]|nr:ABC transporter permease [Blastocatellia bacterium]
SMHDQLVLPAARYLEKGAPKLFEDRKEGWLNVIGRLKPGISMAQALADLKTVASNLNRAHIEANKGVGITIYPLKGGLDPRERGEFLPVAAVLMAVVGVVLLIVCNNLASLLLARSSAREKEIGIRLSLGASRIRLVQQLLTESMVIGVVGGILGLVLAFVTSDAVAALTSVPIDARPDIRVFLFALILSTVAVGAFGLAPAIHASQSSPVTALKGSMGTTEPGRHRLRNLLVIAQITLSLAMLICGGLFLGSVRKSGSVDTGFYAKQGLVVPLDLGLQNYSEDRGRVFYGELLGSVSTQANVQAASLTEYMPLDPNSFGQAIVTVEGKPTRPEDQDAFRAGTDTVEPNYFGTIGIPILKGRAFTQQDRAGSPKVAIVNETMARRFWPNSEAIGNRFSLSGIKGPYYEVVGVAKDGSYRILGEKPQPYLYTALGQNYVSNMTLVVRTANDPARTLESIRSVIHEMDSNLPLSNVRSLKQLVNQSLLPARAAAMLLGAFGVLALILAAAGIYGVTACTVSQRTREIGIRIALGAQRNDVLRLVLREESVTVAVGIILGLALGLGASKVIHSFIFGILSGDVVTFVLVPAVLIGVAFLAGYLPARKATRVSPAIAMNI